MIETIVGERLQCLLRRAQIVEQHVERVEGLEEIVEANEFDVFEIFVHQLSVPLALTFGGVQKATYACLNFSYKEE